MKTSATPAGETNGGQPPDCGSILSPYGRENRRLDVAWRASAGAGDDRDPKSPQFRSEGLEIPEIGTGETHGSDTTILKTPPSTHLDAGSEIRLINLHTRVLPGEA